MFFFSEKKAWTFEVNNSKKNAISLYFWAKTMELESRFRDKSFKTLQSVFTESGHFDWRHTN